MSKRIESASGVERRCALGARGCRNGSKFAFGRCCGRCGSRRLRSDETNAEGHDEENSYDVHELWGEEAADFRSLRDNNQNRP